MNKFKYQIHCHTYPCSHCGKTNPQELVDVLLTEGYAGACITNHFYNGNSGIDRDLSWEEFVAAYENDWLECKKLGEPKGLDIFFGIEAGIGGGREVLCYGVTPKMLYEHPELKEKDYKLYYETLSPLGVLIIQAHPFRERDYITNVGVLPHEFIDGIEVFNFGNKPEANTRAEEYAADNSGLILTSGADAHKPSEYGRAGIATEERLYTSEKLVEVLKSGNYEILK